MMGFLDYNFILQGGVMMYPPLSQFDGLCGLYRAGAFSAQGADWN